MHWLERRLQLELGSAAMLLFTFLLALAGAAPDAVSPATGVMRVRSSAQLYAAFANESIGLAQVETNIRISEQDWTPPILLARSLLVRGVPFDDGAYPSIDFNFTIAKVRRVPCAKLGVPSCWGRTNSKARQFSQAQPFQRPPAPEPRPVMPNRLK